MRSTIPEGEWQVTAGNPAALTKLLGLEEFVVKGMEYDDQMGCLFLSCEMAWDVAVCPRCGGVSSHPHQYTRRTLRDLPMSDKICYLEFTARRFDCNSCKQPFTERLEGVSSHARCTHRYEQYLFKYCQGATIQKISQQEQLGYKAVEGIYYRLAKEMVANRSKGMTRCLGIDEVSIKKGHGHFVLVISDMERGQILTVLPERTKEALEAYLDTWSEQEREAVEEVATDLWLPYSLAIEAKLPKARINADRFHVMSNLNEQVTAARREIQRTAAEEEKQQLKGCRWIIVKNRENLNEEEQVKLKQLFEVSPTLQQLHELKEDFRTLFETAPNATEAAKNLQNWIKRVEQSGLKKLDRFLTTLRNWWEKILNYFNDHITSGFVEGLNNKIKLINRTAYGYCNFQHFSLRLLVECGISH